MSESAAQNETRTPTHTVLNSSDIASVIAAATGEKVETKPEPEKPAEGTETKHVKKDEDDYAKRLGLSPDQHKVVTETIDKAVAKKHRQYKESEEFAQTQFAARRAAEAALDKANRELERLRQQNQPKEEVAKAPSRAEFADQESYDNAMIDWKVDQRLKAREAEQQKQREVEEQQQILRTAAERIEAARARVADFDEVLEKQTAVVPNHIAGYLQQSEMIAELAYHFATHPNVLADLSKMKPANALVAIGKIESKLQPFGASNSSESEVGSSVEKTSRQAAAKPSDDRPRAPAPIVPLNTGTGSQVEKDHREMSYEESKAAFQKRHGVNLNLRQRH